jgi:hypothetical protein
MSSVQAALKKMMGKPSNHQKTLRFHDLLTFKLPMFLSKLPIFGMNFSKSTIFLPFSRRVKSCLLTREPSQSQAQRTGSQGLAMVAMVAPQNAFPKSMEFANCFWSFHMVFICFLICFFICFYHPSFQFLTKKK